MTALVVEERRDPPIARRRFEFVERKGLGHPDTICDRVAESVSRALSRAYLAEAGRVLHHNVDKALLVAGTSRPAFGGGQVDEPMRLVLAGRATAAWDGVAVPVHEIALAAARGWIRDHLRYVDPDEHVLLESALRPGSTQLAGLFARERGAPPGANDTSAGIGYWPLSETERAVLAAEAWVNDPAVQARHPEAGEDVKVMAVRVDGRLELTVAVAFVDRHVAGEREYLERKEALRGGLLDHLAGRLETLDDVAVVLNALDAPGAGADGLYLTVLGTSADGADGGQVGRGNRVHGLLSFGRPASLEAAAGKNPVSHVGKIYNLLALEIARRVHSEVDGVDEAEVQLVSRIGSPLAEPWCAAARLALAEGTTLADVEPGAREVIERELAGVGAFVARLLAEPVPVS